MVNLGGTTFFGNFSDLASAMQVTAQTAPTQLANLVTNGLVSMIVWLLTCFATVMCYFAIAKFCAGALIAGVPFVNRFVGDGGSTGVIEYVKANSAPAMLTFLIAILCSTGAVWSLGGMFIQSIPSIAEACSNAVNVMSNTPESIKRFKQLVNTTNNKNKLAEDYNYFLSQEKSKQDQLQNYAKTNAPADNDAKYLRLKSEYTGYVAKCQIIADAIGSEGYSQEQGQADNTQFKQHLAGSTTNTSQSPAFNPAFIVPATAQAYGVSLPTRATN